MRREFEYLSCRSLEQAQRELSVPGSLPYAGGTDILVAVREGALQPLRLVDLKRIPELHAFGWENGSFRIGACVPIARLAQSAVIESRFRTLSQAARRFACHEIRNRATIGGNIANAAPCAQTAPPLAVLDAQVEILSHRGLTRMPFAQFITGVSKTALIAGQLVTAVLLPEQPPGARGTALRSARVEGMDLAGIHLAVQVSRPRNPDREIKFCFGSVTERPERYAELERLLSVEPLDNRLVRRVAAEVETRIAPRASSLRATPLYKKAMAGVMLGQALAELFEDPSLRLTHQGRSPC